LVARREKPAEAATIAAPPQDETTDDSPQGDETL